MGTQIIEICTDPINLSTECIGLPSSSQPPRSKGLGRPKGSKSKNKNKRTTGRKRSATEYNNNTNNDDDDKSPNRKKRKPNKSHRDAYPNYTDEDIRKQLSMERKAKNRKSAQESRERRKKQEQYLNDRLPKGLALKRLLLSDKIMNTKSENVHEYVSSDDDLSNDQELNEMKMIIDEMADNYASDYDQYPQVIGDKAAICDSLIIDVLKQYINPLKHEDEDSDDLVLETDNNPIHIQVIQEIEDGVPMQFDQIPQSATPQSFKTT